MAVQINVTAMQFGDFLSSFPFTTHVLEGHTYDTLTAHEAQLACMEKDVPQCLYTQCSGSIQLCKQAPDIHFFGYYSLLFCNLTHFVPFSEQTSQLTSLFNSNLI